MAFLGFSAITAAQTGVVSAISTPVWAVLPEDVKEQVQEMQKASLLGVVSGGKLDIGEKIQPLGGVAINVGGSIATTTIESGLKKTAGAPAKIAEDPLTGFIQLLEGVSALSQGGSSKIPVNFTTTKMLRAMRTAAENNELDFSGVVEQTGKTFGVTSEE